MLKLSWSLQVCDIDRMSQGTDNRRLKVIERVEQRRIGSWCSDSLGRILVVDDEPDLAEPLQQNPTRHGYDVTATVPPRKRCRCLRRTTSIYS